ncbi:MAG: UDP-N-acetylmuramoyl-tripeptide--D-alanyl-D-alanine ligase [Gammaproteobacteria bacterium]|nr:UDP-N-acetylmuramoyl-tripeptide--D-alanyl-D-alanine ligase [Gammaproteobacteria bacterium]
MTLSQAAKIVDGVLTGDDVTFTAVATDTRQLRGGELFVALTGPNFDGHDFLERAGAAGAVAAMVNRSSETRIPFVTVQDTRLALGGLARHWRARMEIPLIAVTGSNGKTTVKEMIAAILRQTGRGLVSEGNLNNDIGVPVSLLRLRADDRFAVVEMGMNHAGEIDYLSRIAQPTIAVITNAAEAHLEGLGRIERVARAKAEIFNGLSTQGVAVLNADDTYVTLWQGLAAPRRCVTFGLANSANVEASYQSCRGHTEISMSTHRGQLDINLPLPGKHNVLNALAAAAASLEAGVGLAHIKKGLERMKSVSGRLQQKQGLAGARVFDDSYNANPASLQAALEVLTAYSGERVLVLGDMAELGISAARMHADIGRLAKELGVEQLLGVGDLTSLAVEAFGQGGRCFNEQSDLIRELKEMMHGRMTVLVKGSRRMGMERVVDAICMNDGLPACSDDEMYH